MISLKKESNIELIVKLRKELHNIPEKSMHEVKTKQLLMHFIETHTKSLEMVDKNQWFYVVKKGKCHDKPIAFRADYDAVTCADGCPRHLCGHDGHSAVLAGFSLWLDTVQLERDVYLIFQPGEENGMGAAICASLIEEKNIAEIYGFHNLPGYPCGEVVLLNHTFACASTGLEIKFQGKQSHAAYPENGVNPANAIAEIIQSMNTMIQEKHKGIVLGTVIGIEVGSHSYGVSAGEGTLRLTLRAEYQDEYDTLVMTIEDKAKALAIAQGLSVEISRVEEFPATINDKECVDKISKMARQLNQKVIYAKEPFRWSEDFGYYLQKTKGAFIGIGCGVSHPALHTMEYEFNDEIMESVIEIYKGISELKCSDKKKIKDIENDIV